MTEEQSAELSDAVNRVNAAIASIKQSDGHMTRIYPSGNFSEAAGCAQIYIEVTTGLRRFPEHS